MIDYDYKCFTVEQDGPVATIRLLPAPYTAGNLNWELGELFSRMRGDNSIRVIVLTGSDENFNVPGEMHHYHDPKWQSRYEDPARLWHTFTGIIR